MLLGAAAGHGSMDRLSLARTGSEMGLFLAKIEGCNPQISLPALPPPDAPYVDNAVSSLFCIVVPILRNVPTRQRQR